MPPRITTSNGYYGPQPVDKMSILARYSAAARVHISALMASLIPSCAPLREVTEAEACILKDFASQASFDMWCPNRIPAGFGISAVQIAPYSRDSATITLSGPQSKRFEIAQRRSWISLAEELLTARLPYHQVPYASGALYVVHGRHGGEPIDHAYWATRHSLHFELRDLSIEFREIRGLGPGLPVLLRLANRIQISYQKASLQT